MKKQLEKKKEKRTDERSIDTEQRIIQMLVLKAQNSKYPHSTIIEQSVRTKKNQGSVCLLVTA